MNKKFIAIIIIILIGIVGISAFLLVSDSEKNITNQTNNSSNTNNSGNNSQENQKNSIEMTNHNGVTDENGVTVTANCQITAYQGTNAVIIWKVTNNGNKTIKNVKGMDQIGEHNFGDIEPSQTKTYKFTTRVPTNNELKIDFGVENGQWPGPLWIGGFGLSYSLDNVTFSTNANPMEIQIKV